MWHWQFCAGDAIATGRDWISCRELFRQISELENKVVVYVHNLSYEFQFLKTILKFSDTMILRARKILKAVWRNIEFRCSYLLSNMSLSRYLQKWGVENQKLELAYDKIRWPHTPISQSERDYCVNDVLGLTQAIQKELEYEQLDLRSIPLTSTGYIRREAKVALKDCSEDIAEIMPTLADVRLLRECFRGGNTHANRMITGKIINDVHSYDIASSYPAVICYCKYPVTAFESVDTLEEADGKAWMARFEFIGLRLIDPTDPIPYISISKLKDAKNVCVDNGRLLGCDYCKTAMTDVDWQIVKRKYVYGSVKVTDIRAAEYGWLPINFVELTQDLYADKTGYKGVDDYYYTKRKNLLNSLYGMCVQNPLRDEFELTYTYEDGKLKAAIEEIEPDDLEQKVACYNNHAPLPYQWGVWITAHARARLQQAIDLVGYDLVYCDTDSVKYIGDYDLSVLDLPNMFWAVDPKGNKHYLGAWEKEKTVDRFRTWGAKKYAYEVDGQLSITVAGVEKRKGGEYLSNNGGLEAFKPGFVFVGCGGLSAWHNDSVGEPLEVNGHTIPTYSNTYLEQSDYRLSLSGDYWQLLQEGSDIDLFC